MANGERLRRSNLSKSLSSQMMVPMTDDAKQPPALRVVMMPRDANVYGTIFGGVILSYLDQAGFIEARKLAMHRWVTVSIEKVDFRAPVFIGDAVSFYTSTEHTGTSSIKIRIHVEADRLSSGETVHVTEARLTMVAVNQQCRPIPFASPPTAGLEAGDMTEA